MSQAATKFRASESKSESLKSKQVSSEKRELVKAERVGGKTHEKERCVSSGMSVDVSIIRCVHALALVGRLGRGIRLEASSTPEKHGAPERSDLRKYLVNFFTYLIYFN